MATKGTSKPPRPWKIFRGVDDRYHGVCPRCGTLNVWALDQQPVKPECSACRRAQDAREKKTREDRDAKMRARYQRAGAS